jgi:hypothetical protein
MKTRFLSIFFVFLIAQPVFAYYCSTRERNGFINVGDSMEQVLVACGQPQQKSKPESVNATKMITTQYWIYNNANKKTNNFVAANPPLYSVDREAPMLVLQIVEGKVKRITEGDREGQSGYCAARGNYVRSGDGMDQVSLKCGKPNEMHIEQQEIAISEPQEKVIWTYQWDSYAQPLKLEFFDQKLTRIND